MQCARCGADLSPGVRECPDCGNHVYGNDFVYASLAVSWEEARKGGLQTLEMRNLLNPLRVRLKPRTRTGDKIRVPGAMFQQADESVLLAPVEVTVHVGPIPLWRPVVAVLLCLVLLGSAGLGVWALTDHLSSLPDQHLSATLPSQPVPSTTLAAEPTTEPTTATEPETTEPETTEPETTEAPTESDYTGVIMNYEMRPMLQQLPEDHLTNLEAIYQSMMNFETSIELPCETTLEETENLVKILHYECPELIQFDYGKGWTNYYDADTGIVTSIEPVYAMTPAEYEDMYDACVEVIDSLVAATDGMTDWEKEWYVFDYITTNCAYDMDIQYAGTAYGTLVQEIAKCDGISFAMKWAMEEMGITCIVVDGDPTVGDIGHAWNYILLDGEYYGLDVTADVRRPGDECPVLYCAYNVSTEVVEQTYILCPAYRDYVQTPFVTTMEASYHVKNGSYMAAGADWRSYVQAEFLNACQSSGEFRFQFESVEEYETCKAELERLCNDVWRSSGLAGTMSWMFWYIDEFNVLYIGVTRG